MDTIVKYKKIRGRKLYGRESVIAIVIDRNRSGKGV